MGPGGVVSATYGTLSRRNRFFVCFLCLSSVLPGASASPFCSSECVSAPPTYMHHTEGEKSGRVLCKVCIYLCARVECCTSMYYETNCDATSHQTVFVSGPFSEWESRQHAFYKSESYTKHVARALQSELLRRSTLTRQDRPFAIKPRHTLHYCCRIYRRQYAVGFAPTMAREPRPIPNRNFQCTLSGV